MTVPLCLSERAQVPIIQGTPDRMPLIEFGQMVAQGLDLNRHLHNLRLQFLYPLLVPLPAGLCGGDLESFSSLVVLAHLLRSYLLPYFRRRQTVPLLRRFHIHRPP